MIEALKDDSKYVRKAAAEALGEIGDKVAVPVLIETLHDTNKYVRRAAANALGRIGDQSDDIKED